jgi:hypothetical protein
VSQTICTLWLDRESKAALSRESTHVAQKGLVVDCNVLGILSWAPMKAPLHQEAIKDVSKTKKRRKAAKRRCNQRPVRTAISGEDSLCTSQNEKEMAS